MEAIKKTIPNIAEFKQYLRSLVPQMEYSYIAILNDFLYLEQS
jgi:hypothetical protein